MKRLGELQANDPAAFWTLLSRSMDDAGYRAAAKIFYSDAPADSRLWKSFQSSIIIHLIRENILARVVSHRLALRIGTWKAQNYDGSYDDEPITVPVEECKQQLKLLENKIAWFRLKFRGMAYAKIGYSGNIDLENAQRVLSDVLGQVVRLSQSRLVRQRKRPLCEVVRNYEDVREFDRNFNLVGPRTPILDMIKKISGKRQPLPAKKESKGAVSVMSKTSSVTESAGSAPREAGPASVVVAENPQAPESVAAELAGLVSSANLVTMEIQSLPAFVEAKILLSDWIVLQAVRRTDPAIVPKVARQVGVSRDQLGQQLNQLKQLGLVTVERSEEGKSRIIRLTAEGEDVSERLSKEIVDCLAGVESEGVAPLRNGHRSARKLAFVLRKRNRPEGAAEPMGAVQEARG